LLTPQHAEQVEHVEMIGPCLQNRGVKFFRFGEHSALVKCGRASGGFRHDILFVCRR